MFHSPKLAFCSTEQILSLHLFVLLTLGHAVFSVVISMSCECNSAL